jgi:hypothetical protein
MADVVVRCEGASRGQHCTVNLKLTTRERTRGVKLLSATAAKANGKTKAAGRTVVVARRTVTLAAGLGEVVHVSLNAAGRRALAALHVLPVTLSATENTSSGAARPTLRRFTFKAIAKAKATP